MRSQTATVPRRAQHLGRRWQRPPVRGRDRAPVQLEADDSSQHRWRGDVHRHADRGQDVVQRGVLVGGDEHRSHAAPRTEEPPHDERRFGDEESRLGLDATPQLRVREIDIVRQARIVGIVNGQGRGHRGTLPRPRPTGSARKRPASPFPVCGPSSRSAALPPAESGAPPPPDHRRCTRRVRHCDL